MADRLKNRVREARIALGWSQAEVATRLGVSRQTINALEIGRSDPSLVLAFSLSRLLGQPLEQLFTPER